MERYASWLILLAGILWGSLGLATRTLSAAGLETLQIVILRAWGTVIVLIPVLFLYNKKLLKIKMKDLWCFLGTGICSIIFFNYCYFKTMQLTSLSAAAILLYTAPIIVVILSAILFKEKITKVKVAAMLLAFFGCVLTSGVLSEGGGISPQALVMGLCSGLGYALYSIFSRMAMNRGYHSLTITVYTFLIAAIVLTPFAHVGQITTAVTSSAGAAAMGLWEILAGTVAAYIVYTAGLSYTEAGKASIIASIEPIVATIFGIIIYHESLTAMSLGGIICVMAAITMLNVKK